VQEADGILDMRGCVISISGYDYVIHLFQSFVKPRKLSGRKSRINSKVGRSELEHAITVSGACYCGPMIV
jgi:hypothetical protein